MITETTVVTFRRSEEGYRQRIPYVDRWEPIEYKCDGSQGSLTFDGHYYVEDGEPTEEARHESPHMYLPQKLRLYAYIRETDPYKQDVDDNGDTTSYYRTIENHGYVVEIYKRVKHECTDKISEMVDEDGQPMNVCFFPTNKQTIYFRVLDTLPVRNTDVSEKISTFPMGAVV